MICEIVNGKKIIWLKDYIAKSFSEGDWLELAYSLDAADIVNEHPRLIRSLNFNDDDYEKNILQVLKSIIDRNQQNTNELEDFIENHKNKNQPSGEFISTAFPKKPEKLITFAPHVFQIPLKPQQAELVAVMMPFNREMDETYAAIRRACKKLELNCSRADDIWSNPTFTQDIFDLIFISNIVVADFTNQNSNVFYEVGIAHTLGKNVILITQDSKDIPANLGHLKALIYDSSTEGLQKLELELEKRLKVLMPEPPLF